MGGRRFGVEEELLLVDAETGQATGVSRAVLDHQSGEGIDRELQQEQVEVDTAPVRTLDDLRREVVRLRVEAAAAAERTGVRIAALATSPLTAAPTVTPDQRYERMVELYRLTAAEQLTCGLHVHVETASAEEGVGVLDRIRPWLAVLLALSTNSPFWQGQDTGYQSYRTQAWSRWPAAGPTAVFGSVTGYRSMVASVLATGTLLDEAMLYFHARLGRGLPTVEVRVADVCLYADDALLIAALTRALVDTAAREWQSGTPAPTVPTELLTLAAWRASRSGLGADLIDPRTNTPSPAWDVVVALRRHVRDSLDEAGDGGPVDALLDQLRRRGTGSDAQRAAYARSGDLAAVVRDAVRRTTPAT